MPRRRRSHLPDHPATAVAVADARTVAVANARTVAVARAVAVARTLAVARTVADAIAIADTINVTITIAHAGVCAGDGDLAVVHCVSVSGQLVRPHGRR
ncbi:MAG: hypothetical protein H0T46_29050 [Deltaproteobacteria bacterium]|nr:hypothetical protein [Deltaproteobacteria bacterium]